MVKRRRSASFYNERIDSNIWDGVDFRNPMAGAGRSPERSYSWALRIAGNRVATPEGFPAWRYGDDVDSKAPANAISLETLLMCGAYRRHAWCWGNICSIHDRSA